MDVKWEQLRQADWEEFHSTQHGALQQAWTYGEALTSLGVNMSRAMVWQEGQLVAIAQFMCKRVLGYISLASCTRGPIFHPDLSPAQRADIYKRLRQTIPLPRLKVPLFSPDRTGEQLDPLETRGLSRVMPG
jgi:hypothetical protein